MVLGQFGFLIIKKVTLLISYNFQWIEYANVRGKTKDFKKKYRGIFSSLCGMQI